MTDEIQPSKSKTAEREEHILAFWQKDNTFRKTLEKKSPKGDFVFYDGPPFATGLPHYGHILAGTIKDVIPRFKTMQGYHVPRRWGWDCHGLPVENEVEKELGFKSKKDIINFGIAKFNAKAKEAVMRYADDWRRIIPRMGRWVDMDNDYRTMDTSYTESVWWSFKSLFDKGLIYEGFKSMHLCPRCETTLSNFEVTQGYKDLTDTSVFVKFALEGMANTYAVAWTTTPWTLPGNVALAVHPDREYAFVTITASNAPEIQAGDTYIIGANESVLKRVFGKEELTFDPVAKVGSFTWNKQAVSFEAKKGVKGSELALHSYRPLFDYYAKEQTLPNRDRGWKIYTGDFVTEADGTGIVHIAPAFGEDDYQLALSQKLPFVQHIGTDGAFKKEVADPEQPDGHGASFAGMQAKPKGNPKETDEKIAGFLKEQGSLLRAEPFLHPYPHCWRCDTPLLNFAAPSWFVKVTGLRDKLVAENNKVAWVPEDVGKYRFGNWLAEAKDWAISRARFWGAPIPAWRCDRCHALRAVGSLDELRQGTTERITKVTFLRHGESTKNRARIMDDSLDSYPLTREGRVRAREAGRRIKEAGGADVIFSSPILRTKETATIVGKYLGKSITVEEGIREVDSGEWDGKRMDDPAIKTSEGAYYALSLERRHVAKRGDTGESWEDVEKRMTEALKRMLERHKGESIVIVSHEGPIVHLLRVLKSMSFEETSRCFKEMQFEAFAEPITVYLDHTTEKVIDLHRPFIDDVLLSCEECKKKTGTGRDLMRRVSEVFDCWYESGSMPYGQAHYPFEHNGAFDPKGGFFRKTAGFPADFIAEGLDQTRGWFYSLLVLGTALFEKTPYRNVIVNGIILAENGAKMSKRLKNYPDPLDVVGKYGADALRYYLLSSPVVRGEDLKFSERGVDEVNKKVFGRLDNVLAFYLLYVDSVSAKGGSAFGGKDKGLRIKDSSNVLDKWIIARLNQLISEVTKALESYELDKATRPIGEFVDDLSTWYLRRSRDRIKSDVLEEKESALATLRFVLCELSKIMAPFTPFFAEYVYQAVQGKQNSSALGDSGTSSLKEEDERRSSSVHLEQWPSSSVVSGQLSVLQEMEEVRKIVSFGLEARAKANIKVRQPLASLKIRNPKSEIRNKHECLNLIKEEINIKEIVFDETLQTEVELDTAMTAELKEEGQFRELVRTVQEMRKRLGLSPSDKVELLVKAEGLSVRFIEQYEQKLSGVAGLRNISHITEFPAGSTPETFKADEVVLELSIVKE